MEEVIHAVEVAARVSAEIQTGILTNRKRTVRDALQSAKVLRNDEHTCRVSENV
jgi:hypothetical protein